MLWTVSKPTQHHWLRRCNQEGRTHSH